MALGVLGWASDQFWAATPREFHFALNGWFKKNGLGPKKPGFARKNLEKLMERYPDA